MPNTPKFHRLILWGIILLALQLRLYQFTTPLADWHSFRQSDTASVAREYVKHGINLFIPKYHDLSNIQSGFANLSGHRMVEFPLIPALVAATFPFGQIFNLELHVWFRFINILLSLGSLIFLYRLVKLFSQPTTALIAAGFFAILPYNIYYSRTTLPEVALLFFSLGAMYFGLRLVFLPKKLPLLIILYSLFSSLALLIKPTAIFYLLVFWYVQFRHTKLDMFLRSYLVPCLLSLVPLFLWRRWITHFPEGIPVFDWLLNSDHIRFKGAWFYWLFYERIGNLILGSWGTALLIFGLFHLSNQRLSNSTSPRTTSFTSKIHTLLSRLFHRFSKSDSASPHFDRLLAVWGLSLLAYLVIFATGNVKHDYYQIILIPYLSILLASGVRFLIHQKQLASYFLLGILSFFMLAFSWYKVRDYYHINNWAIVHAGMAVDQIAPSDALLIAPYMGDTAFLYQTNRRGWPIGFNIDDKIAHGAGYYITVTYDDEARELESQYLTLEKTDEYLILDLTHPQSI